MSFKDLLNKHKKPKQRTFVYCPKCKNELVSGNSFVEDNDGIVKYKCDKCGNISFWDFANFPVPYLITCARDCRHVRFDKFGSAYCEKNCDPDTMTEFEPHGYGCEFCDGAKALTIGKTNDQGIVIQYPNKLMAYGYDIHGPGSNGLSVKINYCPICGKQLKEK